MKTNNLCVMLSYVNIVNSSSSSSSSSSSNNNNNNNNNNNTSSSSKFSAVDTCFATHSKSAINTIYIVVHCN